MEDETDITEITIQPDGRVYVFGASRGVLDLLAELCPEDLRLQRLVQAMCDQAPKEVTCCHAEVLRCI